MASTNHTPNYALPQWEHTDAFKMEDFNAAFSAIDTQMKSTAVAVSTRARLVTGSYTGNGTYGQQNPNHLDFADTLGVAPAVLFVRNSTGNDFAVFFRGATRSIRYQGLTAKSPWLTWSATGVSWYDAGNATDQFNGNMTYYYVAIA